ncbi:caspase family protein [Methylomicrobium sp. Wu6]|uniref:caspase family protein n=1 Tax=Methylomicrobium sp. Wu6 TaxID=3107928 RepID=UPI002DD6509D|nr:caspase family protein [Methylomicrobium sp. Wu6]MEC4750109.1 caspase family protein [Methylomicrobium sp. Wu6]
MKPFCKPGVFGSFSVKPAKIHNFCLISALTVLVGCAATSVSELNDSKATAGYDPKDTDKLFVVDCLLPGQVRKLGARAMYLTARRPIQTTAGDCEMRGGEYVAYDRANAASSLKIWLPQAQQGDPEAQVKVGEIYEKGLGGMADPKLAAEWYLKAAEKGNSQAQINLGYLYEKGLGVKQDKATALNWYRKASGLANSDLQFSSVIEANYQQQLTQLREESQGYKEEAENLRTQLDATRQQLTEQKQQSRTIERQLDETRNRLNQEKGKASRNEGLIESLQQEVETKKSHLKNQQQQVSQLEKQLKAEERQLKSQPKSQVIARQEPKQAPATEESEPVEESQVNTSENNLAEMEARLKTLESQYQASSAQINMEVNTIEEKAKQASSTQEKLAVETLRTKLSDSKSHLLAQGGQIKELKNAIAKEKSNLAQPLTLAKAGPSIEILDPPVKLTRGTEPSFRLRSATKIKEIIGKISSPTGLRSLQINELPVQPDKDGVFKSEIPIASASTSVKIVATDKQNRRSLISFNLLAPTQSAAQTFDEAPESMTSSTYPSVNFGKFYALIIGNNNYASMPTLNTSANDAKAVDEVLRSRYGFQTKLLINANRHQIMTAFNDLRQSLTDQDNLLIYYAGHGEIDKSDESAYWLPTDAEPNNTANWLSSFNVTQYLNVIPARHILVIADSCYSGAMTQGAIVRLPKDMPEDKREKWLKFMMNRKARTVMTSGGEEPVLDSGGGNHSVFAKALLNALKSNKGMMVDYELFRIVSGQVKKSASMVGFQQSPEYSALQHAGHEGSPFFFVPKG